MSAMASQITGFSIVCLTVGSGADQRNHQSSASLAVVRGIHRCPVNSPHKWPVTRKIYPFDDAIITEYCTNICERINSTPPGQDCCHFTDDIFRYIFVHEKLCTSKTSLKVVLKSSTDNRPALVYIMAWRQAIICTNDDPVHRCIYAALGEDELKPTVLEKVTYDSLGPLY